MLFGISVPISKNVYQATQGYSS